jgi:hypothetical protein
LKRQQFLFEHWLPDLERKVNSYKVCLWFPPLNTNHVFKFGDEECNSLWIIYCFVCKVDPLMMCALGHTPQSDLGNEEELLETIGNF